MQKETITILGCGWLGLPLAKALVKAGYQVKGSTTREENLETLRNLQLTERRMILDEILSDRQSHASSYIFCCREGPEATSYVLSAASASHNPPQRRPILHRLLP